MTLRTVILVTALAIALGACDGRPFVPTAPAEVSTPTRAPEGPALAGQRWHLTMKLTSLTGAEHAPFRYDWTAIRQ